MSDLIALAKQAGCHSFTSNKPGIVFTPDTLQAFADLIAQREREACIQDCRDQCGEGHVEVNMAVADCINAIRARTTT